MKKAKKLILNNLNLTETKYTLWSDNLRLNMFMHSRHRSQEATFFDFFFCEGNLTLRSFVSEEVLVTFVSCERTALFRKRSSEKCHNLGSIHY